MAEMLYFNAGGRFIAIPADDQEALDEAARLNLDPVSQEEGNRRRLRSEYRDSPIAAAALGAFQVPTIGMGAGILEKTGFIEPGTTEAIAKENPIAYYGTEVIGSLFGPMLIRGAAKGTSYAGRILEGANVVGGKTARKAGEAAEKAAEAYLKIAPDNALTRVGERVQNRIAQNIIKESTENASRLQRAAGTVLPLGVRGVAEGSVYGGAYGINEELITNPDATAEQILSSAIEGTAGGAFMGPLFALGLPATLGGAAMTGKAATGIARSIYGDMVEKHGEKFGKALSSIFIHGGDEIRGKFQKLFGNIASGKLSLDEYTRAVADVEGVRTKVAATAARHDLESQLLTAQAQVKRQEIRLSKGDAAERRRIGKDEQKDAVKRYDEQINALKATREAVRNATREQAVEIAGRRLETEEARVEFLTQVEDDIQRIQTERSRAASGAATTLAELKAYKARTKALAPVLSAEFKEKARDKKKSFADARISVDEFYSKYIDDLAAQIDAKNIEIQAVVQEGVRAKAGVETRLRKELAELESDAVDAKMAHDFEIVDIGLDQAKFDKLSKREIDGYVDEIDRVISENKGNRAMVEAAAERLADIEFLAMQKQAEDLSKAQRELKTIANQLRSSNQEEANIIKRLKGLVSKEEKSAKAEFDATVANITSLTQQISKALQLPKLDQKLASSLFFTPKDIDGNFFARSIRDAFLEKGVGADTHGNEIVKALTDVKEAIKQYEKQLTILVDDTGFTPMFKSQFDKLVGQAEAFRTQGEFSLDQNLARLRNMVDDSAPGGKAVIAGQTSQKQAAANQKAIADQATGVFLQMSRMLSEFDTAFRSLGDIRNTAISSAVEAKSGIRDALKNFMGAGDQISRVAELENYRRKLTNLVKYNKGNLKNPTVSDAEEYLKLATDLQNAADDIFTPMRQAFNAAQLAETKPFKDAAQFDKLSKSLTDQTVNLTNQIEMMSNFRQVLDEFAHFMRYDFVVGDKLFDQIESITKVRKSDVIKNLANNLKEQVAQGRSLDEAFRMKQLEIAEGKDAALARAQASAQDKKQLKDLSKKIEANFTKFMESAKANLASEKEFNAEILVEFAQRRADAQDDFQTALDSIRQMAARSKDFSRQEQSLIAEFVRGYRNAELAAIATLRDSIKKTKKLNRNAVEYINRIRTDQLSDLTLQEVRLKDNLNSLERRIDEEIGSVKLELQEQADGFRTQLADIARQKRENQVRHRRDLQDLKRESIDSKRAEAKRLTEIDEDFGNTKSQLLKELEEIEYRTREDVDPYLRKIDDLQAEVQDIEKRKLSVKEAKARELDELSKTHVDQDVRDLLAYRQRDRFGSVANAFGLEAITNAVGSLIPTPVAVGLYASFKLMDNPRDILRIAAGVYGAGKFTREFIDNRANNMIKTIQGAKPEEFAGRRSVLARAMGLTLRGMNNPDDTMSDEEYNQALTQVEDQAGDQDGLAKTMLRAQGKFNQVEKMRMPMDQTVARAYSLLNSIIPPQPEDTPFGAVEFVPTPEDKERMRDALFVINDPIGTFFYLASRNKLTPQIMQMMSQVYPQLTAETLDAAIESFQQEGVKAPYSIQVMFSLATKSPMNTSMNPQIIGALQQNISQPPAGQEQPGGVNMTQGGVGQLRKSAAAFETPMQALQEA